MSQLQVNRINDASGGVLAPISSVMRNRIINGAMVINQRNASVSVTAYTVDRWNYVAIQASKGTCQQNAGSVTPPAGFTNYLGFTSSSAYSVLSGDTFLISQAIEGFNTADLAWGTANAQTVTVSFWVRSSLTGTFGGNLNNSAGTRSYLFSYTINSANTWEKKTVTIAGDTTGTWATDNTGGIILRFGLGSGATFSGTANAWQAGNLVQPTGSVSVVGTNGATWYITGVQLEVGTQATSFEYRQYQQELALCQRYYRRYSGAGTMVGVGSYLNTTNAYRWGFTLDIPMRVAPTVLLNTSQGWGGNALGGTATIPTSYSTPNVIDCDVTLSSAMGSATAQTVFKVYMGGASPFIELSGAEL
jgi:hypothetical protein